MSWSVFCPKASNLEITKAFSPPGTVARILPPGDVEAFCFKYQAGWRIKVLVACSGICIQIVYNLECSYKWSKWYMYKIITYIANLPAKRYNIQNPHCFMFRLLSSGRARWDAMLCSPWVIPSAYAVLRGIVQLSRVEQSHAWPHPGWKKIRRQKRMCYSHRAKIVIKPQWAWV